MKGEFTNLGAQGPQEDIIVTINSQPATAPTGTPGDIPPKVEPSVPPRQEAESLWHDPTAHELRGKEEQSDATESELWSSIESNPNFEVSEIIPKQSMRLSTQSLTNKIVQKPQEGVVQILAGVIEVNNETYAVVSVIDGHGGQVARKPHVLLTKFTEDPDRRPEIVGVAVPDKPLEEIGDEAGGSLRLEIDEHFGIKITNTSEDAIRMVSPTVRTKAELLAEFGRQRLEEDFGIKPDENVVAIGSKAVSLAHENPFDNQGQWAAKSSDVREAIDAFRGENQLNLTEAAEVKAGEVLDERQVAVLGDQISKIVRDITRKEKQTPEDKAFVRSVVDKGSRIIISGLDMEQLLLPKDNFAQRQDQDNSTKDFLKLARRVGTKSPEPATRYSDVITTLSKLTGGDAVVDISGGRLDPKAEDYAMAVMKYLALMVRESGHLDVTEHQAGNINNILAHRDKVLAQNETAQAA